MKSRTNKKPQISIIIPAYNAETWIPKTVEKLRESIAATHLSTELIIVNDGSSDNTSNIARSLKDGGLRITVIDQENSGRFVARKTGLDQAKGSYILFIDTRVFIDRSAFAFIEEQLKSHPERRIWNAHVNVAKEGNIIARFGDAITYIGWRKYFQHPRLVSYGIEDFDYYPKGTTCFFAEKSLVDDAVSAFLKTTTDVRYSSDDTLLIRHMASQTDIYISPGFSCTYFARTKLRQFIKHTFGRGMFFVDGFLRPGTRFFYPLILFLLLSLGAVIALTVRPLLAIPLLILLGILWTLELIIAIVLKTPTKDAFSLFLLSPLFTVVYGTGIWRAVLRRLTGV